MFPREVFMLTQAQSGLKQKQDGDSLFIEIIIGNGDFISQNIGPSA